MATLLVLKSIEFSQSAYDKVLYKHFIRFKFHPEFQCFILKTKKDLLPFYTSLLVTFIPLLTGVECVIRFYRGHKSTTTTVSPKCNNDSNNSNGMTVVVLTIIFIALALWILLHLCVTCTNMRFADTHWGDFVNRIYRFQQTTCINKQSDKYFKPERSWENIQHLELLQAELKAIFSKNENVDYTGILSTCLGILFILVPMLLPAGFIFTRVDPLYHFVHFYWPHTAEKGNWIFFFFRYFIMQWSVMEYSRSSAVLLIPAIACFNVYNYCLQTISQMSVCHDTLNIYTQLQCITTVGRESIRELACQLMIAGFFICVLGNFLALRGWSLLPPFFYAAIFSVNLQAYIVIGQTISMVIQCMDISISVIRGWKISVDCIFIQKPTRAKFCNNILRSYAGVLLCKRINAQRPVAFSYGFTKFEKETKSNFFVKILEYTLNIVLIVADH